jgi:hypothetical protein
MKFSLYISKAKALETTELHTRGKNVKLSQYSQAGAKWGEDYSSYSFLTLELSEVSGQRHVPATLYLRKSTYWMGC